MRKLKFVIDRKSLQTIYFSFIRPLLEYADVMWDNCTQYEANELEKSQNEAARIVTGATRLVFVDLLYTETGWDTLISRRNKHKIITFHKMLNGLSPLYLSALLPSTVGANVSFNVIKTVFKQYTVTPSYTIINFFRVLYEFGMVCQKTYEISTAQHL